MQLGQLLQQFARLFVAAFRRQHFDATI